MRGSRPPHPRRGRTVLRSGPVAFRVPLIRRLPGSSPTRAMVPRLTSWSISSASTCSPVYQPEQASKWSAGYRRLTFEVRQPSDQGQQGRPVAFRRGVDEVPGSFLCPVHAVPVRVDALPHEQIPAFLGVRRSGSMTLQNNISRRSGRWKHASSSTVVCGSVQPSRVRASAHSSRPGAVPRRALPGARDGSVPPCLPGLRTARSWCRASFRSCCHGTPVPR